MEDTQSDHLRFTHDTLNLGVMSDTRQALTSTAGDTQSVVNRSVYLKRTRELGAKRLADKHQLAGISRSTQHRWLKGCAVPDMALARQVATRLGITLDELIVEVKR